MKLVSKEICPVTVRDRLIKNLANQDIAVSDIVKALEWAEAKCLELNERIEFMNATSRAEKKFGTSNVQPGRLKR